ncbi:MAG: hypothetical protein FGM61_04970 [Sediminibacterium sp.]|nr:hypothetical protein [Sediminibacterium sp.]
MNNEADNFFTNAKLWPEELKALRAILQTLPFTESIKWGNPCYSLGKQNIVMLQPFKSYCALGFFKGAGISDKHNLLVKPGEHTQEGRQMRFENTAIIQQQAAIILQYVNEAIRLAAIPKTAATPKKNPDIFPPEFVARLQSQHSLKKAFTALSPGRQRAYQIYFDAAQQSTTRERRIDKMTPLILSGKGINDCTCGLSKKMPYCDGSHKQLQKQ